MMIINLLPDYDEGERQQKYPCKKIFCIIMMAVVCLTTTLYIVLGQQEADLQKRVTILLGLIENIKSKTGNKDNSALELYFAEELFAVLSRDIARKSLCFTAINRSANVITFRGRVYSAFELTEFLQAWRAAALFSEIHIKQLSQEKSGKVNFSFQGLVKNNKDL